ACTRSKARTRPLLGLDGGEEVERVRQPGGDELQLDGGAQVRLRTARWPGPRWSPTGPLMPRPPLRQPEPPGARTAGGQHPARRGFHREKRREDALPQGPRVRGWQHQVEEVQERQYGPRVLDLSSRARTESLSESPKSHIRRNRRELARALSPRVGDRADGVRPVGGA